MPEVTPEQLLAAYASGYFPMAESADDPTIYWFYPKTRGVLPLEHFHTPKSLRKFLRAHPFEIRIDTAFREVMLACGERDSTWINETILNLYCALHEKGHAHSVECWREGKLAGGLYGVSLGGAFFGESMFTRETNASKTALVALVERLRAAGYTLLDAQYVNEHLQQFGIEEIAREEYLKRLEAALALTPAPL